MVSRIGVVLVRMIVWTQAWIPLRVSLFFVRRAADLSFFLGFKRKTVMKNLEYVFGDRKSAAELKRIAVAANRNIACMGIEMLRAVNPRRTRDAVSHFVFDDGPLINSCDVDPRGTIFAVAHSGNIDLPATWWTQNKQRPMAVVMKPLKDKVFNAFLVETREQYRFKVISTKEEDPAGRINDHLRSGGCLCILPDQNARGRGIVVDFLGRPASTYKGAATSYLIGREHTRLIVAVPTRVDGGHKHIVRIREITDFEPSGDRERDVEALTARIAKEMSTIIEQYPESYLWHHRRWGRRPWEADSEPAEAVSTSDPTGRVTAS